MTLTQITEKGIKDGEIINADINASAAIAGTKISPTFTSNVTISNNDPSILFTDGDANPDFKIRGNGGTLKFIDTTNNNADRMAINSDGHVDVYGNLDVGAGLDVTGNITCTGDLTIPDKIVHSGDTDTLIEFGTNTISFDTAGNERLRVDSDGRVMIGQTSSVVPFMITGTASGYGGENTVGVFGDGTSYAEGVGGGITLSGKYNTAGNQVGYAAIRGRKANGTDGNYDGVLTFAVRPNGSNMTERMRLNSSGNLGIGTTSPTALLNVNTPASGQTTAIEISRTTHGTVGKFINSTGALEIQSNKQLILSSDPAQGMTAAGSLIQFDIDGGTKAVLDSGGSLLLGHTTSEHSDGFQIELSDTGSDSSIALTSIQNNIYASQLSFVKARGSSLGARTVVQDGDMLGELNYYGADGTNRSLGAQIIVQVDGTPGNDTMPSQIKFKSSPTGSQTPTDRLRLRASGDVQIPNGNLVIGTSGKGIDFSATSNASQGGASNHDELLDDYEEGKWDPGIDKSSSSMSGVTYARSTGTYTRVGRMVTVWFDVQVSGGGTSGSGAPYLTQLPFAVVTGDNNDNGGYGAPQFRDATLLHSNSRIYGNSSYFANSQIYFQEYTSSGSTQNSTFNGTGRITGQGTYFTS